LIDMNLLDFNTLPMHYQAQFTWDHGTFLSSRKSEDHVINLYSTKSFFIEVYFSLRNEGVDKIISFTNSKNLNPYLDQIRIDEVKDIL